MTILRKKTNTPNTKSKEYNQTKEPFCVDVKPYMYLYTF